MNQSEINVKFKQVLTQFAHGEQLEMATTNISFTPSEAMYLVMHQLIGDQQSEFVQSEIETANGIIQVDIVTQTGTGEQDLLRMAQKVKALFKVDSIFYGDTDDKYFTIDRPTQISPVINDEQGAKISVSVYYSSFEE